MSLKKTQVLLSAEKFADLPMGSLLPFSASFSFNLAEGDTKDTGVDPGTLEV